MHARRQIRHAVTTRLQAHTGLAALFEARTKPTAEERLPFANVITGPESCERLADQWREVRTVMVMVQLFVRQASDVANTLDDLAEQVEALLGDDQTLGGVCEIFDYKGCDPDFDSAAAQEAASLTLNYECKYVWSPVAAADTLGAVSVAIDVAGPRNDPQLPAEPDGQIDAVDVINLPQ